MSQEQARGVANTSPEMQARQEAERDLEQAAMLLLDIAGDSPAHIAMNTNPAIPKKYVTVHRRLTLEDMRQHLQGRKTLGASLRHQDGTTRALCFDEDDQHAWQSVQAAASGLAAAGYRSLLEPSPAQRGGHLWLIFSDRVNSRAAYSQVVSIAPILKEISEYWPSEGRQRIRLPAGRYVTPAFSCWTAIYDADHRQLSSTDLLDCQTPAALLLTMPPPVEEKEPDRPPRSARHQHHRQTEPDETHRQKYGEHRMWVQWSSEQYLIDRFNGQHTIDELATFERNGMINASVIGRPERTASVGVTKDGQRFTDFGAGARQPDGHQDGGDPFEFYVRSQNRDKSAVLRELGQALNREASRELLRAARAGEAPPRWVMDIITPTGRAIYNENAARHGHLPLDVRSGGLGGFSVPDRVAQPRERAEIKPLEPAARPPALPACGCVWQALHKQEEPGQEKETVSYQTLETYKAGTIADLWRAETNRLLARDANLSPQRAGELAAAQLAAAAGREYEMLEQAVRGSITEQEAALYDWLADNFEIKRDLIGLSGTRTLIADMEVEAAYESGQPYEGDYPPPQRACFHCTVTAWQWVGDRYICSNPGHPPE